MAFTASFGLPPTMQPTAQQQQAAQQLNIAMKYLLFVLMPGGQWRPIAAANSREELTQFLQAWLTVAENKNRFTGQSKIEMIPDISG